MGNHNRKSNRLQGYNYAQLGLYFVTICTFKNECIFGRIEKGKMILNSAGNAANQCWLEIPIHFPHVALHEHVIMPNHVHGIIELTYTDGVGAKNFSPLLLPQFYSYVQHRQQFSPLPFFSPQWMNWQKAPFKSPSRTIGSIVRGFKIGVTKWFRNTDEYESPVWQRNYHDHIIRSYEAYQKVSNYIINNPAKWSDDMFYQRGETIV